MRKWQAWPSKLPPVKEISTVGCAQAELGLPTTICGGCTGWSWGRTFCAAVSTWAAKQLTFHTHFFRTMKKQNLVVNQSIWTIWKSTWQIIPYYWMKNKNLFFKPPISNEKIVGMDSWKVLKGWIDAVSPPAGFVRKVLASKPRARGKVGDQTKNAELNESSFRFHKDRVGCVNFHK